VGIPGRLVLDGLSLLRGAFVRMERHSLDFVARQVLGEGKTLDGKHKAEEILETFRCDRERFVQYNLTDARLVLEILDTLALVDLAVARSLLTGLPPDRVSSSVAAFDFLYLKELSKRDIVAPSVRASMEAAAVVMGGGHVFEPAPGLYEEVLVLDFKSLYPSLIRTFQIDPLGYLESPEPGGNPIVAPNGARFRRQSGILTELLDELIPRREQAKRQGKDVESLAIKILMNSFFGVLGTPVCRFYNPEIANAITSSGRQLLLWSKTQLEEWNYRVLYGDTDSLFVEVGATDSDDTESLGQELVDRLNKNLAHHVRERWGVESQLEAELEKVFVRLFLPPVRHGTAGARKRYAGLVRRADRLEVDFTGLEAVRRDWTDLARQVQRELYRRFFLDEPVGEYLMGMAEALRAGKLDDLLIYRKALRKDLEAYTTTTPPHVVAARKLAGPPGRLISYYMTLAGPEPAEQLGSPIDYQHYLDKQLRPVAEPVLAHLQLEFAKVIGDDRQLDLF
jgi:DNA polymerase-2